MPLRDADITTQFSLSPSLAQKSLSLSHVACKQHAKESPQRLWMTYQEFNSAVFNVNLTWMIYENTE